MTDPDRAPEPVADAVSAVGLHVGRVWGLALAQGAREGMELAAKVCESVMVATRNKPGGVFEQDIPAIATAEFLRDKIRELALQVEDPPVA